jgi:hypothetical protein
VVNIPFGISFPSWGHGFRSGLQGLPPIFIWWKLFALFLFGVLAALFAPVKYGLLPERLYRDRDGLAFRGSDREKEGEDRAYEGQESARDVQKERAEVERELRKAAAERDRALEKADAEAAREGQPVKLRQQQTEIWEQYEAKRYDVLTRFEDKRDQ